MSFGSSMRLNVESDHGKPTILWQQEKLQKKTRKFGYKSKDLRHAVRKNGDENYHNQINEEVQNVQKKEEKKVKQTDFIKKNREKLKDNKKTETKNLPEKGTVTLTQEQLNAILESVGKLSTGKDNSLRISIDNELHEVRIEKPGDENNQNNSEKAVDPENADTKTTEDAKSAEKSEEKEDTEKTTEANDSKDDKAPAVSEPEISLPPPIPWAHLTVGEKKRLQWAREKALDSQQPYDPWGRPGAGAPLRSESGQIIADLSTQKDVRQSNSTEVGDKRQHQNAVSTRHADTHTKSNEPERLKASDFDKVPPAAMRSSMVIGHVAPDENRYNTSKDQEKKKWLEELEKQREEQRLKKMLNREKDRDTLENHWTDRFGPNRTSDVPVQELKKEDQRVQSTDTHGVAHNVRSHLADYNKNLPAAIRSSFAIGEGTPNDSKFLDTKEEEKRKWLRDLEKQIELNKYQKEKELDRNTQAEQWADKLSHGPPVMEDLADENTARTCSAPHATSSMDLDDISKHLRGQHVVLDPITHREMEEKKKRYLEYQEAVRHQIEEKQRLKQVERDLKMREELEEELKLKKQRDALQEQYNAEQNKQKNKEEARQHQIDQLKTAMDEAKERAHNEKMLRTMQRLEQGGHDVSHLKAHLQAVSPRVVNSESTTTVPHLDLTTRSTNDTTLHLPQIASGNTDMVSSQYNHEPYIDRVLTPNRFRHPSNPFSEPGSPRRHFGTQTADGLVLSQVNLAREPSDVDIVYHETYQKHQVDAPVKKVRVISAEHKVNKNEMKRTENQEKLKLGEVKWNYQNKKNKRPIKQSERDPFYERKHQQSEMRRAKREQKLMALVEANKDVIPTQKYSTKSRDTSLERNEHLTRSHRSGQSQSPHRTENNHAKRKERFPSSPVPDLDKRGRHVSRERLASHSQERHDSQSKKVHKSRSPEQHSQQNQQRAVHGHHSPPVPALKHKISTDAGKQPQILKITHTEGYDNEYNMESFNYTNYRPPTGNAQDMEAKDNYKDPSLDIAIYRADFIPFTRTADILDPAKASDPVPVSRETTHVVKARQAYTENQAPGSFGNKLDNMQDDSRKSPSKNMHDPLVNPNLVKGYPTARQDMILQQLSTLKQSLRQRQRELETCMSPSDFDQ